MQIMLIMHLGLPLYRITAGVSASLNYKTPPIGKLAF